MRKVADWPLLFSESLNHASKRGPAEVSDHALLSSRQVVEVRVYHNRFDDSFRLNYCCMCHNVDLLHQPASHGKIKVTHQRYAVFICHYHCLLYIVNPSCILTVNPTKASIVRCTLNPEGQSTSGYIYHGPVCVVCKYFYVSSNNFS